MREFARFCIRALISVANCNARALFMNILALLALKYAASAKFYVHSRRIQAQTSRHA